LTDRFGGRLELFGRCPEATSIAEALRRSTEITVLGRLRPPRFLTREVVNPMKNKALTCIDIYSPNAPIGDLVVKQRVDRDLEMKLDHGAIVEIAIRLLDAIASSGHEKIAVQAIKTAFRR
jgi:hypothetical protein